MRQHDGVDVRRLTASPASCARAAPSVPGRARRRSAPCRPGIEQVLGAGHRSRRAEKCQRHVDSSSVAASASLLAIQLTKIAHLSARVPEQHGLGRVNAPGRTRAIRPAIAFAVYVCRERAPRSGPQLDRLVRLPASALRSLADEPVVDRPRLRRRSGARRARAAAAGPSECRGRRRCERCGGFVGADADDARRNAGERAPGDEPGLRAAGRRGVNDDVGRRDLFEQLVDRVHEGGGAERRRRAEGNDERAGRAARSAAAPPPSSVARSSRVGDVTHLGAEQPIEQRVALSAFGGAVPLATSMHASRASPRRPR